jgi:hypothetical protein
MASQSRFCQDLSKQNPRCSNAGYPTENNAIFLQLNEFSDELRQPRLVAGRSPLVDQAGAGRPVDNRRRRRQLLQGRFSIGLGTNVFNRLAKAGTERAVPSALIFGNSHAFDAGLMAWQRLTFPKSMNNSIKKYSRRKHFVNR